MSKEIQYLVADVEEFLRLNEEETDESSISLQKLLSVQDKIKIFEGIDPLELKTIVYDVKFERYKHKNHVVDQGQLKKEIYFVLDGECHAFFNTTRIGTIKSSEVFGESGAIFGTKRNATVVCASQTATLLSFKIDEDNMEFCAPALAILYKNLALQINKKLNALNAKIEAQVH